jgi:quinol monooxygenase YgiN
MELTIIARFHARDGQEASLAAAIRDVAAPTRAEPGCLQYGAYRSLRDPRLYFIHSRWVDEAAFERHAGLPHTLAFLARVEPVIDHPFDISRTQDFA